MVRQSHFMDRGNMKGSVKDRMLEVWVVLFVYPILEIPIDIYTENGGSL